MPERCFLTMKMIMMTMPTIIQMIMAEPVLQRMIIPTAHLDRAQMMKRMRHQKRKLIHRMMNIMKMNMRKKSRI